MIRIISIDTASAACSVGLVGDGYRAGWSKVIGRGHAEQLAPMLNDAIAAGGIAWSDITAVAVTIGPGAFTGLRIGLATARGIALAVPCRCFGITTLAALAAAVPAHERQSRHVLATIDTKRGDLYAQVFAGDGQAVSAPCVTPLHRLAALLPPGGVVVAGDAGAGVVDVLRRQHLDAVLATAPAYPDPVVIGEMAFAWWRDGAGLPAPPEPFYLQHPRTGAPSIEAAPGVPL